MVSEVGSFARHTIEHRLAPIVRLVITENDYPPAIVQNLENLIAEIPEGSIRPLKDDGGPDVRDWQGYIEGFIGKNWLNLPFYWAEAYFYRRILETTDYFTNGIDPFALQKTRALEIALETLRSGSPEIKDFPALLYLSLWGNRADLSLWPVGGEESGPSSIERDDSDLLVDDTARVTESIARFRGERIDVILDNAGLELIRDLQAIDFLFSSGVAEKITLHLKAHPTFVSDAMSKDVATTLESLANDSDASVSALGNRLRERAIDGRLKYRPDFFWNSPRHFSEMPDRLREELSLSRLVIIKGDANYRRLLGELHRPFTTPLKAIASYFPAPFVALRSLKSEIVAGLQPSQVEELNREDPRWLIDGRKGVIQYANGA